MKTQLSSRRIVNRMNLYQINSEESEYGADSIDEMDLI